MPKRSDRPPRHIWLAGRAISAAVARAPWCWPFVRGGVERFFDRAAFDWDSRTETGTPAHLAPLATAVLEIRSDPERILEIGCGTGEASLFLAREFPRAGVRGVDLSAEMIRRATRKIGLDPDARVAFRVGDASRLPWGDDSFDLVAQVNMPVFFREVARVLRPGGEVVVTSSIGDRTPFHTPTGVLGRNFGKVGVEVVGKGTAGSGTWFLGRKVAHPDDS